MSERDQDATRGMERDWRELGDAWRAQSAPTIDPTALRAAVASQRRRMGGMLAFEWIALVAALGMIGWVVRRPDIVGADLALMGVLVAAAVGFTLWTTWVRRRLWRPAGLQPAAMVALEIERAEVSLRYWRVNTWSTFAIWLVVCVAAALQVPWLQPVTATRGWWPLALGLLPVVIASAWFERWRARRTRTRLARLRALRDELADA